MRKSQLKLVFEKQPWWLPLEQAIVGLRFSVLRDMRTMSYSKKYEVYDAEAADDFNINRFDTLDQVKNFIVERINAKS